MKEPVQRKLPGHQVDKVSILHEHASWWRRTRRKLIFFGDAECSPAETPKLNGVNGMQLTGGWPGEEREHGIRTSPLEHTAPQKPTECHPVLPCRYETLAIDSSRHEKQVRGEVRTENAQCIRARGLGQQCVRSRRPAGVAQGDFVCRHWDQSHFTEGADLSLNSASHLTAPASISCAPTAHTMYLRPPMWRANRRVRITTNLQSAFPADISGKRTWHELKSPLGVPPTPDSVGIRIRAMQDFSDDRFLDPCHHDVSIMQRPSAIEGIGTKRRCTAPHVPRSDTKP